jgi:hypothetical protein
MASAAAKYSMDTSSLVAAWAERYPIRHFAPFWTRLETSLKSGLILVSREVYLEVGRKDEELFDWIKDTGVDPIEIDERVISEVQLIMANYPKLVDTRTGKSGVDPFVIALARAQSPRLTVITEESRGGNRERPKIPFVCEQADIGVECANLLGLIRVEDWRF